MESLRNPEREDNIKIELDCFDELEPTDRTPSDSYFEEGEIQSSDDEQDVMDSGRRPNVSSLFKRTRLPPEDVYGNIDIFANEEEMKKLNRAKRFALVTKEDEDDVGAVDDQQHSQLASLYRDLGIDKENERHYRFNAIHMRGIQDMNTEDVLDYFEVFSPLNVEWVSDAACNVVWSDDVSAARALVGLSKRIRNLDKVHSVGNQMETDSDESGIDARDIHVPIPPGFWRIGIPDKKCQFPFLRYATKSDKKQKPTDRNSEECDFPGLLSQSMRRQINQSKYNKQSWKNDQNNQSAIKKPNPWSDLAFEWGKTDKIEKVSHFPQYLDRTWVMSSNPVDVPDLRLALTNRKDKRKRQESIHGEVNLDEDDQFETRSKVPRMTMYADEEEKKKLERISQSQSLKPVEDLRSKITRKKTKEIPGFRLGRQKRLEVEINDEWDESHDEYEFEGSSGWALENYQDLRESLRQNKRYNRTRFDIEQHEIPQDETSLDDELYLRNSGQRSPLQIEIDNDEYYERRLNNR